MKIYIYSENNILIDDDFNTGALISYNSNSSSESLIIFPTLFFADKGVIDLSRLTVNGSYGSRHYVTLKISPKSEGYLFNILINIILTIPFCSRGEYTSQDHHCTQCPANKFLFEPAPFCSDCPQNFKCFGGSNLAPKAGYWRKRSDTLFLISCQTAKACLEGDADNPNGKCDESEGYTGIACAQCMPNYMSISGRCIECPHKKISYFIILFLIGILTLGLNIILIHDNLVKEYYDVIDSNILVTQEMTSKYDTFIKILLNHALLFFSIGQFNIDWPDNIGSAFAIINYGLAPVQAIYSIECFSQSTALSQNLFYFKELALALFPFAYSILIISIWIIISIRKTKWIKLPLIYCIYSSIFIITMQLHANISQIGFIGLNSMEIDDNEIRIYADLRISPKDQNYINYGHPLAFFIILIWGLGILLYIFFILFLNRKKIMNKDNIIKPRYGFLINGYKLSAFYWEFIIQVRKFLIAIISSLLIKFTPTFQIVIVFIVLAVYVVVYKLKLPFETNELNNTEEISVSVCITQYFIIFIILCYNSNSKISVTEGWVILISAILLNLFFIFVFGKNLRRDIVKTISNSNGKEHILIKNLALLCCAKSNHKTCGKIKSRNISVEDNKQSEKDMVEKQIGAIDAEIFCFSPTTMPVLK